jgi:UDP-N-acetylmuramyl pentapeptide phosphotransferase/UDP-N-acetylglucosamine-1-phosphate transferase
MNLLDLRPGRACGVFCAVAVLLLFMVWRQSNAVFVPGLLYIFLPVLVAWTHDADAHVMLGDTGSNLLGASIGLAVCLYCGVAIQIVVLILAVALHVLAERWSITQIVEQSPILRAIDRRPGVI